MSIGELLPRPDRRHAPAEELVFQTTCGQEKHYGTYLVHDVFDRDCMLASLLCTRHTLVVTTPTVWSLYGSRFEALAAEVAAKFTVLVLDVDESSKSLTTVERICASCQEHGIGRTDALLALGGGVCLDLVTVAASLVRRGIAYVCVPTTLVGQIDAGIGIKGAVNFGGSKSYLGTFKAPEVVLVDPAFLETCSRLTLLDGMAEAVKIALIADPYLFHLLETIDESIFDGSSPMHLKTVLRRSITRMLEQLAPNFFEDQTYCRRVDFGHTFSGLIEEHSSYEISHGQAVAVDMAMSASLAVTLGRLSRADFDRILALLKARGLPVTSPLLTPELCADALRAAAGHRGGTANLVIPETIGSCGFVTDGSTLSREVLETSIGRLQAS